MRPVIPGGSRPPQQPTKPFDPKDPSTWPKLSTRQYAERAAAAGYSPLTGKATGTPVQPDTNMYNAGWRDVFRGAGNAFVKAGDFVFKEPAKSVMRTLSTQNLQTALNPRSTATQRINAIGEDAMNIIGLAPGIGRGAAMADDFARPQIQKAVTRLAESRAAMGTKFRPTANLDNYILHGGVPIEDLADGVLDPEFVRGGDKFLRKGEKGMMPVNTGPNQIERDFILQNAQNAESVLSGTVSNTPRYNTRFRIYDDPRVIGKTTQEELDAVNKQTIAKARQYLNDNAEIIKRIRAGEEHQTGVNWYDPESAYSRQGGTYILDVPKNLRTMDTPAPAGEVKFWGKHEPVGFVRYDQGRVPPTYSELNKKAILQTVIDDADIKATQIQKLANLIARARGTRITPGYKAFVEKIVEKNFNRTYNPFIENPRYGEPGEILKYNSDFSSPEVPYLQNYDEVITKIKTAKTEKDIFEILDNLSPTEQVDIALNSGLNRTEGGFPELKRRVVSYVSGINPSYSRLSSIPRGGPIVVDTPPQPSNLEDWNSLGDALPFAYNFMDRRTPAGTVQKVYDPELFSMMFKDHAEGKRILNERLANLGKPRVADWSSLTPDEMGFATILDRNTPAEEVKRLYIQHNLEMEKSLNQGIRDIAEAMAERSGMDITRAYDFAEDYRKWQRRGGRNPGSN